MAFLNNNKKIIRETEDKIEIAEENVKFIKQAFDCLSAEIHDACDRGDYEKADQITIELLDTSSRLLEAEKQLNSLKELIKLEKDLMNVLDISMLSQ